MSVVLKKVKLVNENGLHARPATKVVETANKFSSNIVIIKDGMEVNSKSVIELLTLAACVGTQLTIKATGEDAEEAVNALYALIKSGFSE
ncbi:MAG: HPr family phosphocarrier protein [Planctomycetota bacterium]